MNVNNWPVYLFEPDNGGTVVKQLVPLTPNGHSYYRNRKAVGNWKSPVVKGELTWVSKRKHNNMAEALADVIVRVLSERYDKKPARQVKKFTR